MKTFIKLTLVVALLAMLVSCDILFGPPYPEQSPYPEPTPTPWIYPTPTPLPPLPSPPPGSSHVWPVYGGNYKGTSQSPYLGPQTPQVAWTFNYDPQGWQWGNPVSAPVIDRNGNIYVGTYSGHIFCLNGVDGSVKWKHTVTAPSYSFDPKFLYLPYMMDGAKPANFGDANMGWLYPAINDEGTIFFSTKNDFLLAMNPDGSEKWRFQSKGYSFDGLPNVDEQNKLVYVVANYYNSQPSADNPQKSVINSIKTTLFAVDFYGNKAWEYPADGGSVRVDPRDGSYSGTPATQRKLSILPVIGEGGTVYIASDKGILALDKNGYEQWVFGRNDGLEFTPPRYVYPVIDRDGTIYFAFGPQPDCFLNTLYAINPNGTLKWKAKVGCSESQPAIADDGTIYVPSTIIGHYTYDASTHTISCVPGKECHFGGLYAFTPEGRLKWFYTETQCEPSGIEGFSCTRDSSTDASPVVGKDGTIYLPNNNGKLIAFSPDGSIRWKADTKNFWGTQYGEELDCGTVIDHNGNLYITYNGGRCSGKGNPTLPPCALMVFNDRIGHPIAQPPTPSSPSGGEQPGEGGMEQPGGEGEGGMEKPGGEGEWGMEKPGGEGEGGMEQPGGGLRLTKTDVERIVRADSRVRQVLSNHPEIRQLQISYSTQFRVWIVKLGTAGTVSVDDASGRILEMAIRQ